MSNLSPLDCEGCDKAKAPLVLVKVRKGGVATKLWLCTVCVGKIDAARRKK